MENNNFITSVVNEIRSQADLAWEQLQNSSSTESRVAYNYLNVLLVEIERDRRHGYMISSQEDEDDNN